MKIISLDFLENKKWLYITLLALPVLLYLKSLFFDFTPMDEQWMIVNNVAYLNSGHSLKGAFTAPLAGLYYRPLFLTTIIFDYGLNRTSPFIYHFTNLMWHLLSVILLYRFLMLTQIDKKVAYAFTLLFSIHPLMLHAVAWVPGRNDVMLCVFILLSLIYLHKYIFDQKLIHLLIHFLFFGCALFTKESAVILPVIFITYYWAYKEEKLKNSLLIMAVWLAITACWVLLRNSIVKHTPPATDDIMGGMSNFIFGIILYLGKVIFPFKQSVFPTLKTETLIFGLSAIVTLVFLCFKPGIKNKKIATFGLILFFTLLIIPVWFASVKGNGEQYEHRSYTSVIGLLIFFSQLKFNVNSQIFIYVSGIIIVLFSLKTYFRMNVYEDKYSFLAAGIGDAPDYYLFQLQMGDMFYSKSNWNAAIPYYTKALALRPDKVEIYNIRGTSFLFLGMNKEAISDLNMAIEKSKFHKEYYLNRCNAYNNNGNIDEAMKDLKLLMECCNDIIQPELRISLTEKWAARETEKIKKLLDEDPKNAELYFKRANILFDIGENKNALTDLKKACELDPENAEYLNLYLKKSGEMLGKYY